MAVVKIIIATVIIFINNQKRVNIVSYITYVRVVYWAFVGIDITKMSVFSAIISNSIVIRLSPRNQFKIVKSSVEFTKVVIVSALFSKPFFLRARAASFTVCKKSLIAS